MINFLIYNKSIKICKMVDILNQNELENQIILFIGLNSV